MALTETRFKKRLFGGIIEIIIYSKNEKKVKKVIGKAYEEALRLQKIFNFFDEKSELSKLNRERKLKVSDELFNVIEKALEFSKLTNGKYDISLGKQITKRKKNILLKKTSASYRDIKANKRTKEISLKNPDAIIDLGSIAKGYITDKIADFLISKNLKEFLIDARGDILVSGNAFHLIEIQHPRKKNQSVLKLKLKNQSVATSGDYVQFNKNYEKSHIINQASFISVTVVAPTLELADAYATAIFVSGKKEIKKISEKNKKIKFMTIDKDLKAEFFNGIEELIYNAH